MINYLISLLAISVSLTLAGPPKDINGMPPLSSERLTNPISLENECKNVKIIEWRTTNGYHGPSKKLLKEINRLCKLAAGNFIPFLKEKYPEYNIDKDISSFKTQLCFMPVGSKPRSLNDLKYRFATRVIRYRVWGYFEKATLNIYIRNDIALYKTVFVHELFHSLSYRLGIFDQHSGNQDVTDEAMAQEFTEYLGLGR